MEQQHTSRTGTGHSTATGIGAGVVGVCAVCGLRSAPGNVHGALLPDATVIDPQGRGRDGRRYVTACGREHLQLLIDRARRDWVAEQLWFGLLCRASIPPRMRACPGGGAGLGGRPLTPITCAARSTGTPAAPLLGPLFPAGRHWPPCRPDTP